MRNLLVRLLATAAALYVTSSLIAGFRLDSTWQAYLLASLVFLVTSGIAGPIIKLLLLPINLLTLGLLRWVASVIVLYLFDLLYRGVTISAYDFPGFTSGLLALPAAHLGLFWVLVFSSFTISLTSSLVTTLFHTD